MIYRLDKLKEIEKTKAESKEDVSFFKTDNLDPTDNGDHIHDENQKENGSNSTKDLRREKETPLDNFISANSVGHEQSNNSSQNKNEENDEDYEDDFNESVQKDNEEISEFPNNGVFIAENEMFNKRVNSSQQVNEPVPSSSSKISNTESEKLHAHKYINNMFKKAKVINKYMPQVNSDFHNLLEFG